MKIKSRTFYSFLLTVLVSTMVFLVIFNTFPSSVANAKIRQEGVKGHFSDVHLLKFLRQCGTDKNPESSSVLKCVIHHLDKLESFVKMEERAAQRGPSNPNGGFDVMNQIKEEILKKQTLDKSLLNFLMTPPINSYNFSFTKNASSTCEGENLKLLFVIPSAPENYERRRKFRDGNVYAYVENFRHQARLVFFTGKPPSNTSSEIQSKIDEESLAFEDIVQADYEDKYKNIRLKAVSMLKWAGQFCQNVTFVIRVDDDVTVDVPKIVAVMEATKKLHENFILGVKKENDDPNRDPKSAMGKYFMSREEYPEDKYPPFLLGGLLGYPIETVQLLYQAALRVKPIWLDDVYITGLCAPKVNVPILRDPDFKFKHNGKWYT